MGGSEETLGVELTAEWRLLDKADEQRRKTLTLDKNHDLTKDRFTNVRPWTSNKLQLRSIPYLNASPIPVEEQLFYATQAPLTNTIIDFWLMVLEKGVGVIVTLANLRAEADPAVLYWPTDDIYSHALPDKSTLVIKPSGEWPQAAWIERSFTILRLPAVSIDNNRATVDHQEIICHQLEYRLWPDHGVPASADQFVEFMRRYDQLQIQNYAKRPTVVHCLAGVGRTGTFITGYSMLKRPLSYYDTKEGRVRLEAISKFINQLRDLRPYMVQTIQQFGFLHKVAALLAQRELSASKCFVASTTTPPKN